MNNQSNSQKNLNLSRDNIENTLRHVLILTVISMVLSVIGAGFGIYGAIKANQIASTLNNEEVIDDDFINDSEDISYEKPSDANDIELISIAYNNNEDYIDISRENNIIEYYSYNDEDEYIGDTEETDVSSLIGYIYDNALSHFPDTEPEFSDEDSWSIEIISSKGDIYTSGTGEYPDWFKSILDKLNIDQKGFKSRSK